MSSVKRFQEKQAWWEMCDCDLSPWQRKMDLVLHTLRDDIKASQMTVAEGRLDQQTVDDMARMAHLIFLSIRWLDGDQPEDEIREDIKQIASEL